MRSWAIGFTVLFFAQWAHAEEAPAATEQKPLLGVPGSTSPRFAAPNGQLGAGLSLSPEQQGRAYLEVGFARMSVSESLFGANLDEHITSLSFIAGAGFKVRPNIEFEVMLPIAWAEYGASISGPGVTPESQSDSKLALANLHLGASYLYERGQLRVKAGGAVEWGPWTSDPSGVRTTALAFGYEARAGQDVGLWAPETFSVVAPARIEYGEQLVLGGDAALGVHVPTGGGDTEVTLQLDPSIGFYATDTVLIGLRVPFTLIPTESGSSATFLATEPYARFDVGPGFISTRFTLNIDEPLGFSFDDGKIWALHVGGGGSF